MKSLEGKTAIITVTTTYEYPLCDCCCDHPNDVLNFDYTFYKIPTLFWVGYLMKKMYTSELIFLIIHF